LQKPFLLHSDVWWEVVANIRPLGRGYSGSSSIWTQCGRGGKTELDCESVHFEFRQDDGDGGGRESSFTWRASTEEGQFPYLLFWRL
jgi:hypothetical protein